MDVVVLDPVFHDAMLVPHDHGLIVFDWTEWSCGHEFYERMTPADAADLDRETALKLLSFIARADGLGEGT